MIINPAPGFLLVGVAFMCVVTAWGEEEQASQEASLGESSSLEEKYKNPLQSLALRELQNKGYSEITLTFNRRIFGCRNFLAAIRASYDFTAVSTTSGETVSGQYCPYDNADERIVMYGLE